MLQLVVWKVNSVGYDLWKLLVVVIHRCVGRLSKLREIFCRQTGHHGFYSLGSIIIRQNETINQFLGLENNLT